jgi:hypothetical protein
MNDTEEMIQYYIKHGARDRAEAIETIQALSRAESAGEPAPRKEREWPTTVEELGKYVAEESDGKLKKIMRAIEKRSGEDDPHEIWHGQITLAQYDQCYRREAARREGK